MKPNDAYQDNASDPTNYEVPARYRCALRRGRFLTLVTEEGRYIECATVQNWHPAKPRSLAYLVAAGDSEYRTYHAFLCGLKEPVEYLAATQAEDRRAARRARGWADDTSDTRANYCTGAQPWSPGK